MKRAPLPNKYSRNQNVYKYQALSYDETWTFTKHIFTLSELLQISSTFLSWNAHL